MQKTIHFHVGAHKTATTYVQSRLRTNQQRLRDAGVNFLDLWAKEKPERQYRKQLKRIIEKDVLDESMLSGMARNLRQIVADRSVPSVSLTVLSYENVLGSYDLTTGAGPYPHAGEAVRHIVEACSNSTVRIFLAIRSLDRFLESGFVQRVYTRRETRRFKQYLAQVDLDSLSWQPMVRAIESVVGPENLTIWQYEDFFSDERVFWDAFLNLSDVETLLAEPARTSNASLSAKGLKYMRSINRVASPADARKFRPFVKKTFGTDLGFRPPKLLDAATRQRLVDIYDQDRTALVDLLGKKPGSA